MPFYEFECKKCRHNFSVAESVEAHEKHHEKCPKCESQDIKRVITKVNVQTSRKS